MVTYHRWFILPMATFSGDDEPVLAPKYIHDDDRIDGYTTGGPFTRTDVSDAGYDHLLSFNDADRWRVVAAWGEGNEAWNALNEIHANHHDTDTLADHGQDVEPVMNQRFGASNWSVDATPLESSNNTG